MFALYGQPVPTTIIEKAGAATMLLSCDVRFAQIDATEITFGDSTWTNPPASETVQGVSRRATVLQAVAGNSTDTTMTPQGDKAALDGRLGAGAPTAFVKALLNLATAALFRTAIGIKDVATLNMGTGGGIDADMLDGKHAAEFATAAHSHSIANIMGLQSALDAKAATGHSHSIGNIMGLQSALDAKAPSASPELTGTPVAPTAAPGTNTTQLATTEFVQAAIAAALANYLPKNNPTFTGTMTGPNYNKPV